MDTIYLMGPTAAGKHEAAVILAERLGAEIVSVDSMKVYRGMDIGTAKPDRRLRERIAHHLIDICDPADAYSAGRFVDDARRAQAQIQSRGRRALFVGGTALYYKAHAYGLFEGPMADAGLRRELLAAGPPALHEELERVDPVAARRIHPNDLKRLVRAVEVYRKTGEPISRWQTQFQRRRATGPLWCLRRSDLRPRIQARVRRMFEKGLVDEVQRLRSRPWSREGRAAVGYREILDYLDGKIDLIEAEARIVRDTLRFVRRQETWLRSFPEAVFVDAREDPEETARLLEERGRIERTS
ncbi:MAG: tRNA (adenosine(37)-N6)-dimethylallyltransferase MiaA [Planctomycetes bacterium]|nr:tRNA (adenosine(37)-N6)-dimethylallyltransferase MiaA [Planctomycetota bacterium]